MNSTPAAVLDGVAEAFVARCRTGEEPDWQDYAADHPELAAEMEAIFPLMQLVDGAVSNRLTEQGGAGDETLPTLSREVVGDYQIIGEIGRGGMGAVYEAEQISLRRRVALKVQSHGHTSGGKSDKRFRQEAQAAAQLVHPNIVPVYDVGEDGEFAYYAMQLIEGQPLDEFIDDVRRLRRKSRDKGLESRAGEEKRAERREERAADGFPSGTNGFDSVSPSGASGRGYFHFVARFGAQVADAVAFAHARGIIHRDIKPSNLLLDRDLAAWVTDFGLAKIADSKLTQTGDVLGTVRYMAPEQFRGWSDSKSDAYSLGATLYELIALRPPYQGPDRIALIRKIATDEPERLRKLEPRVPRDLETIIHKSLSKEPAGRYQSAADFRDDLRRFLDSKPIHARHDSLMYLTRKTVHRYRAALLATVLIVVSLVIGLVGMSIAWKREAESAAKNCELAQRNAQLLYLADLREAFRTYQGQRPDQVQRILQAYTSTSGQQDLRCVAWQLLDRLTRPPTPSVLPGHEGHVNEVAVVPGTSWMLSVGNDSTIRIWDHASGKLLHTMHGDGIEIHAVAVSPDGRYFAAASSAVEDDSDDSIVWLWSLETKQPVRPLHEVIDTVESLAFSPDGRHLAIGDRYDSVWLVNVEDGSLIARQPNGSRHKRLIFTSDAERLISPAKIPVEGDAITIKAIQVWDAEIQRKHFEFDVDSPDAMALSHNGRWLAASSEYSDQIHIYDLVSGKLVSSQTNSGGRIESIEFSPDDAYLAVAQLDGRVRVWEVQDFGNDVQEGERTGGEGIVLANPRVIEAHDGRIRPIVFIDNDHFATCGEDGLVKFWSVPEAWPRWIGPRNVAAGAVVAGPGGNCVAILTNPDNELWVSKSAARGARRKWIHVKTSQHRVKAIAYSPDGNLLAAGLENGDVELFAAGSFERAALLPSRGEQINDIEFSPDAKYLVTASGDHMTHVWRAKDGKLLFDSQHQTQDPRGLAISPSGLVAVGGTGRQIEIYDIRTGEWTQKIPTRAEAWSLDWSADGKVLASGHTNGDICIWNLEQTSEPLLVGNHRNSGIRMEVRFLDGGTRLVSATGHTVRIWDLPTRRELGVLYEGDPLADVFDLAISRDGEHLYAGFGGTPLEHNIAVWPLK